MRRVAGAVLGLGLLIGAAFWFGPYEPVELSAPFDAAAIERDVDAYLTGREGVFDDLRPGAEKQVLWAGAPGEKTPLSLVYVHGFSASAQELRPVPDALSTALTANLYFTRLAGHGRPGAALAGPTVQDWMTDMAEAMVIGRAIGDQVIVIGTSTGGTLAALMALDDEMSRDLKGVVFISPNFRIKARLAPLLTWPGARHWLPVLAGAERSFAPQNEAHAAHWTVSYPTEALFPMAALVQAARRADYAGVTTPALFYFSPQDQVVDGRATQGVATNWGGAVTVQRIAPTVGVEPYTHVLAGDILSPNGTDRAVAAVLRWIDGL